MEFFVYRIGESSFSTFLLAQAVIFSFECADWKRADSLPDPLPIFSMNHCATLENAAEIRGVGLHTGQAVRLNLCPSEHRGIVFARVDLPGAPQVEANWRNVTATTHATTLQQGHASVMTTEHLLAALWASGITHCRVELDAPEVAILDGSAKQWCEAINLAGVRPLDEARATLQLREPVWIAQGETSVFAVPCSDFRVSVAVNFDVAHAGAQLFDEWISPQTFAGEIAGARTFTLQSWLEPLQKAGLIRGGSLDNAILIDENGWSSPPRFANELARHKALDLVGDLALLFGPARFCGHIIATRAGHGAHRKWMEACRESDALQLKT